MSKNVQIRVSLSAALHERLVSYAKRVGLSEGDAVRSLLATSIKDDVKPTTTAIPAAQPRRALTHEEKLFGMARPEYDMFPSEEEMEQRRKAVLDALE